MATTVRPMEHVDQPLMLSSEWVAKTVTTDAPRYTPYTEWELVFTLEASVPLRAAVFLSQRGETGWGLLQAEPATVLVLRAGFSPFDWARSEDVQVSFEWQRINVTDRDLKLNPRDVVQVTAPAQARTAELVKVAELPSHGITMEAAAFAETDTERRRHDRWRVRPTLTERLPERLRPLGGGQQSGSVPLT